MPSDALERLLIFYFIFSASWLTVSRVVDSFIIVTS